MLGFTSSPDPGRWDLWEIFRHRNFLDASPEQQNRIKLRSAQFRYDYESEGTFFAKYFPAFDTAELEDRAVLDLGCFTGGRLVYWAEHFKLRSAHGVDINPIFGDAGRLLAEKHGVAAEFRTGFGEELPYDSGTLDVITSFDVLEHVRDVGATLRECHRVLKPGGRLFSVFPQFYQPLESHLGLVTKMPALHWFFNTHAIVAAFNEIERERGDEAYWYRRDFAGLADWEKLPTLNGITVRHFRQLVNAEGRWTPTYWNRAPILSSGRRAARLPFRLLRMAFWLPARLPFLEELFLDRICCALRKTP